MNITWLYLDPLEVPEKFMMDGVVGWVAWRDDNTVSSKQ